MNMAMQLNVGMSPADIWVMIGQLEAHADIGPLTDNTQECLGSWSR
jgi:hypothetical protein